VDAAPERALPRGVGRKSGGHYIGAARLSDSRPHVACLGSWSVEVLKRVELPELRDQPELSKLLELPQMRE
jgi:hypothetical protein